MKREEKNQQTRRRIIDSAVAEFSENGYAAGSMNSVCKAGGFSKGIIYHYFATKDDLFLACAEECFRKMTDFLRAKAETGAEASADDVAGSLDSYFNARAEFFREEPVYRNIFSEAVVNPPAHLKARIAERKKVLDDFNKEVLRGLLSPLKLRDEVTLSRVIEMFGKTQDFINVSYEGESFEKHEEECRMWLDVLLYGIIERQ